MSVNTCTRTPSVHMLEATGVCGGGVEEVWWRCTSTNVSCMGHHMLSAQYMYMYMYSVQMCPCNRLRCLVYRDLSPQKYFSSVVHSNVT